jgi:16S rRNA processing protein RimM
VAGYRWHSGNLLVRFEGIGDRTAAAELGGTWLLADSATFAALDDPDVFRDGDLVGLCVRTVDGTVVGTVTDVLHHGQDILTIAPSAGAGQILVPFVKAIVPEVDLPGGVVVIDPPEGLLNLEDAT